MQALVNGDSMIRKAMSKSVALLVAHLPGGNTTTVRKTMRWVSFFC